jgi:hypothetical protein
MHNTFHVDLLKACTAEPLPAQVRPVQVPDPAADAGEPVERILDHKVQGRTVKYLVRWEGYSSDFDEWVLSKNVSDDLIAEYQLTEEYRTAEQRITDARDRAQQAAAARAAPAAPRPENVRKSARLNRLNALVCAAVPAPDMSAYLCERTNSGDRVPVQPPFAPAAATQHAQPTLSCSPSLNLVRFNLYMYPAWQAGAVAAAQNQLQPAASPVHRN